MPRTTKKTIAPIEKHTIHTVPAAEQPYPVPENWRWVKLSQIIDVQKEKTENFSDDSIRYIGLENMEKDEGIVSYGCASDIKSLKNVFKAGNILYGKLRPYLNKHDIAPFDGICSTDILVFNTKNSTINNYVNHYFDLQYFIEYAVSNSKGINLPRVSADIIMNATIPLPPLAEQQRIVDRIERLFAKLDEAREKAQAVVDGFENRKAAILHKAFTGELTRKWREERGIGMESWKQTTLGNIIKVSSGKALTAKNMIRDGIYPVYGGNGITGHHNESNVDKNTIVIGRVGYYCGSVHFLHEPSWVTDNALIVKYDVEQYNTSWLVYILKYLDLRQNDSSTAQPVISGSKIYPICLNICSKAEQTIISNLLDRLLLQERRARDLAESVIAQIDVMKKAILARAFRGELGTNDPQEMACEI